MKKKPLYFYRDAEFLVLRRKCVTVYNTRNLILSRDIAAPFPFDLDDWCVFLICRNQPVLGSNVQWLPINR